MPLTTGTRLGNIEIVGPLGKGGMGEVYRGRDTKLDREVAVKVLPGSVARDPERLARFEREAKVLASLNHSNIAQIYAVEDSPDGTDPHYKALIMELVKGETLTAKIGAGADLIHVDVMDGHFVPNITIGPVVVRALKRVARVPLDVHLMIADPDRYLVEFAEAGASMLSVHVEVLPHLHRTLQAIKALGVKAGVALNPSTPVGSLEEIAGDVDFVLVMSVNPGFGGQAFIPRSESKVREVGALLARAGSRAPIEVDGGIDTGNAARVVAAGATILVAGSALFHAPDPERATRDLRAAVGGLSAVAPASR
jgi:ribulose-phosphate 3-epimerase